MRKIFHDNERDIDAFIVYDDDYQIETDHGHDSAGQVGYHDARESMTMSEPTPMSPTMRTIQESDSHHNSSLSGTPEDVKQLISAHEVEREELKQRVEALQLDKGQME